MKVPCTVCGEDVEITLEEFLEGDEWFCDNCCTEALIFLGDIYLRANWN